MSDYLASSKPDRGGDTYNVQSVQGSVIGGQHGTVNQTNTFGFNPADVGQLVQFVVLARQIAPTLGFPDAEYAELVGSIDALELEAGSSALDEGRLKRASVAVMRALTTATTMTAGLNVLIAEGQKAYNAVFGG